MPPPDPPTPDRPGTPEPFDRRAAWLRLHERVRAGYPIGDNDSVMDAFYAELDAAVAWATRWHPITDEQIKDGASFMCWHRLWDCPMWAFYDRNHATWKLTQSMFAVGIPPSHYFPLPEPPIRSDPDAPAQTTKE